MYLFFYAASIPASIQGKDSNYQYLPQLHQLYPLPLPLQLTIITSFMESPINARQAIARSEKEHELLFWTDV
jgi:hypothetical protein